MRTGNKKRMKGLIILLAVLCLLCFLLLCGVLLKQCAWTEKSYTAYLPNNMFFYGTEATDPIGGETLADKLENVSQPTEMTEETTVCSSGDEGYTEATQFNTKPPQTSNTVAETKIALHRYHRDDNEPFSVKNMFPGDSEKRNYGILVSYQNTVTVCFNIRIREGYEQLAEVMKCRVVLLTTGETLYDGLMRLMPATLNHLLSSETPTEDVIYYEVSAYLDTSIGNAYQNQGLMADLCWWIREDDVGNLEPPKTGDAFPLTMLATLAISSLSLLLLLCRKVRREGKRG